MLALVLLAPGIARAQSASEVAVKAAFLLKFSAYIDWPAGAGPMTLCTVGRNVLGGALERAASGQHIGGRPVQVRRLDTIARGSGCDLAYLTGSAHQSVPAALAATGSAPVLTVTDGRWSNVRGMIHFQIASNRVRFHIDDQQAAASGLSVSSKLLSLALSVRQRQGR
jgi:hypothetical protein